MSDHRGWRAIFSSLLGLTAVLSPLVAEAASKSRAKAPATLRHPEKVGLGAYPVDGSTVMAADIRRLGARWYYDWSPRGSSVTTQSWMLRLPGPAMASRDLRFVVATPPGAGLVCLEYAARGRDLGTIGLRLDVAGANYPIAATAPAGTTKIRLSLIASEETSRFPGEPGIEPRVEGETKGAIKTIIVSERSVTHTQYIPMIWGASDAAELLAGVPLAVSDTLFAFNEPDLRQQANLTVKAAISLWPTLMATGRRLSSPAVTTGETLGPGSWLGRFMTEARARRYRVDFIAVHYYTQHPNVVAFRRFLEKVHIAYGRPIWVTEWALADWSDPSRFALREQRDFFERSVRMLDALPFVERHAWFGAYRGLDSWDLGNHLLERDGTFSPLGEAFRRAAASISGRQADCDLRRARPITDD